jgi:hypothetical protein
VITVQRLLIAPDMPNECSVPEAAAKLV